MMWAWDEMVECVISPLEGEMAGRPEGVGSTGCDLVATDGGWRSMRGDPLCRLRRHLPLEGGDVALRRAAR
ncbi:hypothetical protein ASD99_25430 [Mesorhizobium sp. Root695]|nr:hypothetical protein ASD99_25430 [Mesorhizobium sp. Root695]